MTRSFLARVVGLALAALLVAGCDKCGNRIKPNLPTLPLSCGENADPAK